MEQDWLTSVLKFIRLNLGFIILTIGFCVVFAWGGYRVTRTYFSLPEETVVQESTQEQEISQEEMVQIPEFSPIMEPSPVVSPSAVPSVIPTVAPTPPTAPEVSAKPTVTPRPTLLPTSTPKPTATPTIVLTPKPSTTPTPQAVKNSTATSEYIVKAGDSTSKIAQQFWGNGRLYPEIEKANNFKHNQRLAVGQKLTIPAQPAEKSQGKIASGKSVEVIEGKVVDTTLEKSPIITPGKSNQSSTTYTVQLGDSLWKISAQQLGNPYAWTKLYELNKKTIGRNPHLIYPGAVLHLPQR